MSKYLSHTTLCGSSNVYRHTYGRWSNQSVSLGCERHGRLRTYTHTLNKFVRSICLFSRFSIVRFIVLFRRHRCWLYPNLVYLSKPVCVCFSFDSKLHKNLYFSNSNWWYPHIFRVSVCAWLDLLHTHTFYTGTPLKKNVCMFCRVVLYRIESM